MGKINSYQDLEVWKQSRLLMKKIYLMAKKFPESERFSLTSQLRRAAISIPSNIAEGCGRNHYKDSIQFFFIARGSLYELENQLVLASDLEFVSNSNSQEIIEQVALCKKLLNGFINYFKNLSDQQRTTINEQLQIYGNSNTN